MVTKLSRADRAATIGGGNDTRPILVIEDDPQISRLVCAELRDAGFQSESCASAKGGLQRFERGAVKLVILDLTLPDMDGLKVCEQIRSVDRLIPIMMLTARAAKIDVVRGLEFGADDYVTKPFDSLELIARVRALLRRRIVERNVTAPEKLSEPLCVGPLIMNEVTHETKLNDQLVDLTAKEFELLWLFAQHPGRSFTRDNLLSRIWGEGFEGYEHTVNTHINRLRMKLAPASNGIALIETVWGVGYRFAAQSGK